MVKDYIEYTENLNETIIDVVKEKMTAQDALMLAENSRDEVAFENANCFLVSDMIKITLAGEGKVKFICKMAN